MEFFRSHAIRRLETFQGFSRLAEPFHEAIDDVYLERLWFLGQALRM